MKLISIYIFILSCAAAYCLGDSYLSLEVADPIVERGLSATRALISHKNSEVLGLPSEIKLGTIRYFDMMSWAFLLLLKNSMLPSIALYFGCSLGRVLSGVRIYGYIPAGMNFMTVYMIITTVFLILGGSR